MREVAAVRTDHPSRIRFTTVSGSVYEVSLPDASGSRVLQKGRNTYTGTLGVAMTGKEIMHRTVKEGPMIGGDLQDGRAVVEVETISIGQCFGFLFKHGTGVGGLGSSQIVKIEIE